MYVFYFHFEMRVASRIRRVVYTVFIFGPDRQFAGPFGLSQYKLV